MSEDDRKERANAIATELANHSGWLTHGRSIKIEDLRRMRLHITDYSENTELADAIRRYFVLLQMTFEAPNGIYKVFETAKSQIYRFSRQEIMAGIPQSFPLQAKKPDVAHIDFTCANCGTLTRIQANLKKGIPLAQGAVLFPATNSLKCSKCGNVLDLTEARKGLESQTGKKIVIS